MKQKILLIVLCFSAVLSAQIDTLKTNREARQLLREGNKLYHKGKYNEALIAYRKALGKNAKYDKASYNYGNTLYLSKNYKDAISQYEVMAKSAENKLDKAQAFHNMGDAMLEQKQYQQAVEAFKNALRNNPKDDETRYNLAVAQKYADKEKQNNKQNNNNKDDKQNKDNKDNKDNKNDKNKQDKKSNKDDQKDKKDQKDNKNKDKQDKSDKDNQKDQNKDKQGQGDNDKKPQSQPKKGTMSKQQLQQLLESLNNEEKKTQKKIQLQKAKAQKNVKRDKDW